MTAVLQSASGTDALLASCPDATTRHELTPESPERGSRDPRAIRILAKSIYRELRQSGQQDQDVMLLAGELLSLLASDVKDRRRGLEAKTGANPPPHAR